MIPTDQTPLSKFIIENINHQNLLPAAVARGIGISQTYLSNILNGEKNPSIETVNKIADFFKTPRTALYQLMGWIDIDSREDQDRLTYLLGLAKQDPQFTELVDLYSQCMTDADRRMAIRILRAVLEDKK